MINWINTNKLFCLLILSSQALFLNSVVAHAQPTKKTSLFQRNVNTDVLSVNHSELEATLLNNRQSIVIALPLPNGELVNFRLSPDKVMADGLAKKYPSIRTFSGVSLDNPNHTGRFDITPNGFHGMFYLNGQRVFVEPKIVYAQEASLVNSSKLKRVISNRNNAYTSYFAKDNLSPSKSPYKYNSPKLIDGQQSEAIKAQNNSASKLLKANVAESAMTTYRIAISASAEYTEFHGGTVDNAMAEIVTLVNRLNQVYQHDLAIKLELVENNDLLVFTDAGSDPFNNDSDDGDLNTGIINGIIGSDNYDIGHIVNTEGGGLAVLGAVCSPFFKGDGVTGAVNPINDAFYIDYVAHEIGHQFGANHTFNGTAGGCEGNREKNSAYEVGSGSTIMSYAGLCNDQDLQRHSDAFFHARSIDEIKEYLQTNTGSSCGTVTGNINNTAVVNAGLDYTIPAQTPFKLTGSAQDSDSNILSYSWQQFDLGNKSSSLAEQVDDGSRPIFRAFLPNEDSSRYFPQLSDVLNGTSTIGESLPTTDRELNFRLMVFDNEGGVSFDETKLTVVDTGEAFVFNTPVLDDIWTTGSTVSWQVAGTDVAPINCATVDVLLSKNGGETFDTKLANNVANNGSADITISGYCPDDINTTQARLKLVCNDNVFYAINNGAFKIDKALTANDITITSQQTLSMVQGESLALTNALFSYGCEAADSLTIQSGNNFTFTGSSVTPDSDFTGQLSVPVIVGKGDVSAEVFDVIITVEAKAEPVPEPEPEPIPETSTTKSSGGIFWLLLIVLVLPWRQSFLPK